MKQFTPQVTLVLYHFHINKLMNEKLTMLRRDDYTQTTHQNHKDVLKAVRWLFLRNTETKTPTRKYKLVSQPSTKIVTEQPDLAHQCHLKAALDLTENFSTAHSMKRQQALIWQQSSEAKRRENT